MKRNANIHFYVWAPRGKRKTNKQITNAIVSALTNINWLGIYTLNTFFKKINLQLEKDNKTEVHQNLYLYQFTTTGLISLAILTFDF